MHSGTLDLGQLPHTNPSRRRCDATSIEQVALRIPGSSLSGRTHLDGASTAVSHYVSGDGARKEGRTRGNDRRSGRRDCARGREGVGKGKVFIGLVHLLHTRRQLS